jgi:SAM-dependent methyltransferase
MRLAPSVNDWTLTNRIYWESIGSSYAGLYSKRWSKNENRIVVGELRKLQVAGLVLDLGCGAGLGYQLMGEAASDFRYVGMDVSSSALTGFRAAWCDAPLVLADMSAGLPFVDDAFDSILALFTSMSYAYSPEQLLGELYRILKPRGRIYLSVVNRSSLRRVVRLKHRSFEQYRTRDGGVGPGTAMAHTHTRRGFRRLLAEAQFGDIAARPIGVFSGIAEPAFLWPIDRLFCHVAPTLAHLTDWTARKAPSQEASGDPCRSAAVDRTA